MIDFDAKMISSAVSQVYYDFAPSPYAIFSLLEGLLILALVRYTHPVVPRYGGETNGA